MPPVIVCSELPGAGGGAATAAALGVAIATSEGARPRGAGPAASDAVILVERGAVRGRGPTMLAADAARTLERKLVEESFEAAARGHLAWVRLDGEPDWIDRLTRATELGGDARAVIAHLPAGELRSLLDRGEPSPSAVLLRADLPAQRALAALAVVDIGSTGVRVKVAGREPGRVAARRALAGIEPGGETGRRARRLARAVVGGRSRIGARIGAAGPRLAAESGQALPLALGGIAALIFSSLLLAALGGAVTGTARTQRAADLAAISGARSMRDDFDRLFAPARTPSGAPNPAHLAKSEYLARARAAAIDAARHNGVAPGRLRVDFPDRGSFAPLHVRAAVGAEVELGGPSAEVTLEERAEAEAVLPSRSSVPAGQPGTATGGGYSGPLAYRQGKPMRPDVAAAFDRMARAASGAGISLLINSAYRSDAEQAALFAENPDPQWVAPPGTSLHRCATELDLGPPAAYAWLAANAGRFGFTRRYAWEPWHYGFDGGPAPCSPEGDAVPPEGDSAGPHGADGADGVSAAISLPAFVPARFRAAIASAASRWNVPAALLAAQLMAESNFNPFAVSAAGAQGIAQFMPSTAASYGLSDPFDPEASIDAQAHLMSDLVEQFGQISLALAAYNAGPAPVQACGCVPAIPETQAYVARILGLMDGAGEIVAAPALEVRLVS